jgi:hypothetical protein
MTPLRHSAAAGTEKWSSTPENWSGAVLEKGRTMVGRRQPTLLKFIVAATFVLLTVGLGTYFYRSQLSAEGVEVAVLFPSTDSSDWQDFVRAVHLAASEKKFHVVDDDIAFTSTVQTSGVPVRFRWYPFIGSYQMQKIVRQLCQQKNPPIAIVGANNTSLTETIGAEIRAASNPDSAPILLMTFATTDPLIDINPGRSFRFGFSNSHQARAVVERLSQILAEPGKQDPSHRLNVIIVQVLDNPFSIDLARHFEKELSAGLSGKIIPPPAPFNHGTDAGGMSAAWSLNTATTEPGNPTTEESALATAIVATFARDPSAPAILVLPVGSDAFVNIAGGIRNEMKRLESESGGVNPIPKLTIITGDSLDYYEFAGGGKGPITARSTPARVLFFSHVNPVDRSVHHTLDEHCPTISLDREVARTLLEVIPTLGNSPTPSALVSALNDIKHGKEHVFKNRERVVGGGVVVADPDHTNDQFQFIMPSHWTPTP